MGRIVSTEQKIRIKRTLHLSYNSIRVDHLDLSELDDSYFEKIKKDVEKAKEQADYVVACIHSGGQFNPEPGDFTKYIINKFSEFGVDAVVANHPHIVQRFDILQGTLVAFSLGNYSISPSSVYLLRDYKPEYSVALHLYMNPFGIKKVTFSILKVIEKKDTGLTVVP